jgi:hypothetical protein
VTYDPATDAGKVRLLCTDTATVEIFTDAEIAVFLELNGDSILFAAAMALDVIADNEILVQKRIKLLDLSTDGPSEAKELRAHADSLRLQAGNDLGFDYVENPVDVFSLREKTIKDYLRGLA